MYFQIITNLSRRESCKNGNVRAVISMIRQKAIMKMVSNQELPGKMSRKTGYAQNAGQQKRTSGNILKSC